MLLELFVDEYQTRPGDEPHQNSINNHQNSMFILRNLMHILHVFFFDKHQTRLGDEPLVVNAHLQALFGTLVFDEYALCHCAYS